MKRLLSLLVILLGLTSVRAASAADVCITPEAQGHLNSCQAAGVQFNVGQYGKTPKVSFHQQIEQDKKLKENKPDNPDQSFQQQRDERQIRLAQRQLGLLITVIQQSEELLRAKPLRAPNRVIILRRLAEDYVELESAAFREKTEAEIKRDQCRRQNNQACVGQQNGIVQERTRVMNDARRAAIGYYTRIATEYGGAPSRTFPQDPPAQYGQLDEVLYYLAYEYEGAQNYEAARKVYYDLINKVPTSKYVPNAYLAFGELFFQEAQTDPSKWPLAQGSYEKVITKPPPENKVYGYAWYKLGYVFWNTGDFQHALAAFRKVIDYGTNFAQLPNAAKLADSARKDIIPVYAQTGAPDTSYSYFHDISGDTGGSNEKTYKMMDDLGLNYMDTGHYPEVVVLYQDLLARDSNGEKSCTYQSRISEAVMALAGGSNKPRVVQELTKQKARYDQYNKENHSAQAKLECANRTAELIVETAMAWHLEAVGSSDKQRGTMNPQTLDLAADLYKLAADTWTADEFSKFQFHKLVRQDWPTLYRIKYNMADLMYFRERWKDCGPAFQKVVEENPRAPEATEAAYASVLCYINVYTDEHKNVDTKKGSGNLPGVGKDIKKDDESKYAAKEMTDSQKGMLHAFDSFICYIHPQPNDKEGMDRLVEIKYDRARLYYETNHWEEAGGAFLDVALNYPNSEYGIYAANLYLESINVLTWHGPKRSSCVDDMAKAVPKFIDSYCGTPDKQQANGDTCTTLGKVQCDIQRLAISKLVDKADANQNDPSAVALYQQAGDAYMALWTKYGETPISKGQAPACEKLEEVVYNAAKAYQAGRFMASAINARKVLLNPQNKMDQTEFAKDAMYSIGQNYQAIADYSQASDFYERYAQTYPHRENADKALSDAIVLRLGLGDEDKAIADADVYKRNYGTAKPAQTAQIAFAVGAHYAEKEDWDNAVKALSGAMYLIDKAPADIQLQAHAALGRAYRAKKNALYKNEYARVRSMWGNDGSGVVADINKQYAAESDDLREKRLGKSLDAVGEAYFMDAEDQKAGMVDVLVFPAYNGSGSKEDVSNHIQTKVKDWFLKKRAAIAKVDHDYYQKVTDLRPHPPPRWVIASASRAGLMWGDFVDDFRKAPIPKAWESDDEIRGVYFENLDAMSEPMKVQNAKPALVECLNKSVQFQYFDQYSRACEAWLAKNYKTEYHVVDEIRGAPTLVNSGLDDRPPPLVIGGTMWHPPASGPATEKAGPAASTDKKTP